MRSRYSLSIHDLRISSWWSVLTGLVTGQRSRLPVGLPVCDEHGTLGSPKQDRLLVEGLQYPALLKTNPSRPNCFTQPDLMDCHPLLCCYYTSMQQSREYLQLALSHSFWQVLY
jgi:hypothetical protein